MRAGAATPVRSATLSAPLSMLSSAISRGSTEMKCFPLTTGTEKLNYNLDILLYFVLVRLKYTGKHVMMKDKKMIVKKQILV